MLQALQRALERRSRHVADWQAEGSDAYRLLHGVAEGVPGLTVDRYGPVLLVQTWRGPLPRGALEQISAAVNSMLGVELVPVWNHRAKPVDFARWFPDPERMDPVCSELGVRYLASPRHRGNDPLLFLDLRVLRRRLRGGCIGSVLNTFAYTCGVGVCAALGGAREVWNVDFAASALAVGRRNAELNEVSDETMRWVEHDCLPTLRQLAGLRVGRPRRDMARFEARSFDTVVLDPPRFSKGPYGAVDLVRDYAALFKPAVLATTSGGTVIATNNVAKVDLDGWLDGLHRCARKAGRPLGEVEVLTPEADFPSFDGRPPLKIAWCSVP